MSSKKNSTKKTSAPKTAKGQKKPQMQIYAPEEDAQVQNSAPNENTELVGASTTFAMESTEPMPTPEVALEMPALQVAEEPNVEVPHSETLVLSTSEEPTIEVPVAEQTIVQQPLEESTVTPAPESTPPTSEPVREAPTSMPTPVKSKLSALDAAFQVLTAKACPMTTTEMIQAMTEQGLWASPKGKTPANTLYSALLAEITKKGSKSRFSRPERGKFAARTVETN